MLDGKAGRINNDRPVILYSSGRLVVVRELGEEIDGDNGNGVAKWKGGIDRPSGVRAFVYRGHAAPVTAAKFSPSGCYVASADLRGKLRVWSYDNQEHLCKLDLAGAIAGPIRDISWDFESKRLCIVGEGSKTDSSSLSAKVIQWDTGVTCGDLGQHTRNRVASCTFKPSRPMRIATGGADDSRVLFNKGPPFGRIMEGVADQEHARGAVNCIRYSPDGGRIVSVGTDKSVVFYDGKSMELVHKMAGVHTHSIYACDWSSDSSFVVTSSADGTVKLIDAASFAVVHTWDIAGVQGDAFGLQTAVKTPIGAMQMAVAFVKGDVPVAVGMNGNISLLPVPPGLMRNSDSKLLGNTLTLSGHQAAISAFAMAPDSMVLYTGDTDGVICSWDLAASKALGRARVGGNEDVDATLMDKVHLGAITAATFAQGSLVTVGWDDKLRIGRGMVMDTCISLEAQPNVLAKGTALVCCVTVKGIILIKGDQAVSDLIPLPYSALSACVSADDSTLIVGGEDCKIHIYSVDSSFGLSDAHVIEAGHLKPVHALTLSHDGTKLASADVRDVCVWSGSDGWSPLIGKGRWCFHTQRVTCLAWSKDDSVLASGGNDDSIYLWSLAKKMKRVHYPFVHRGGLSGLEFLNGMVLVSAGSDGCVNQWDVTDDIATMFG